MKKYVLSFLIPFFSFLIILILKNILFGDYSILYSDAQYQYQQLLIYLKQIFEGISNPFYSFQIGFGTPMIATFAYYLISPFNILVNLFSYSNIEYCFMLIILLKISLCGLTMYTYLNYNYKSRYTLVFSTAYALSYYIIANYFQMMWLDAYYLAPLLLLSIDKLIKDKKPLLYGIVLFIIILTSYYMGYMCCIFSVLYFFYKYLLREKKDKEIIKMFFIVSLLAGLMTLFIHLPNLLDILQFNRTSSRNYLFNHDLIGALARIFIGTHDGKINNEYYPYLYIGIFNIILLIFYFVNKKIKKKEKILSFAFVFILIISVLITPINNFWHALSDPIGFNYRYIFLFNIFFISLCLKSLINIKYVDKTYYYLVLIVFLFLANLFIIKKSISLVFIYVSVVLFIIYLFIFKTKSKDAKILFTILALAELFFNSYITLYANVFSYRNYLNGRYNEKISIIQEINDDDFYRMEFSDRTALNDPLNYGYYGVTGWLSSNLINSDFHNNIGYYSYNNFLLYSHYLLLDSLFGIKYYESLNKIDYYELLSVNQISSYGEMLYGAFYTDSYLYKNPYALSLGYMVDDDIKNNFYCDNAFDCQNEMVKQMTNYDGVYEIEEVSDKITITSNKDFYLLLVEDKIDTTENYNICLNNECYGFNSLSGKNIYIKNNFEIGDEIDIKINGNGYLKNIYLAYFDFEKFQEVYDKLADNQLNITDFKENHIKGNINVSDEQSLFLSIPYNDNFKILVDGQETEYYKVINNFIGLDLEKGNHDIEIIYEVKGLKLGLIISLTSFFLFIIYTRKHL